MTLNILGFFYWDPSPQFISFQIPLLSRPIYWYGVLFALGFFCGYRVILRLLRDSEESSVKIKANFLLEKLSLYIVVGTVLGARWGDCIFYQDWYAHPHYLLSALKLWEGRGLASHGGAIGLLCSLALFKRNYTKEFPFLTLRWLMDLLAPSAALAGGFIRIGNFINQEVLGKPSTLPWAVIFGSPVDGHSVVPRHPVQIYESLFYFCTFLFLYYSFGKLKKNPGRVSGLFFLLIFSFRFMIEFLKEEQSALIGGFHLIDMGQILSLPFIFLGFYLMRKERRA